MHKYLVIALLFASCAVGGRVPLTKKPISKATFHTYRESVANREVYQTNGLGQVIPLKDYMNTQYFAEVKVGTPA